MSGPAGSVHERRAVWLGALALGSLALSPALALTAQEKAARGQELQRIEQDLKVSEERAAALKREVEALKQDRVRLNQALIDTGARLKAREKEASAGEERLKRLSDNEAALRGSLEGRRFTLLYLRNGALRGALMANNARDRRAAAELIARRTPIADRRDRLADPAFKLAALVPSGAAG